MTSSRLLIAPIVLIGLLLIAGPPARGNDLGETDEVLWSLPEEPDLLAKASELATPVLIYEFVRNEVEYVPYHGARSSSTNSFLGRIGNDVDIASTLIAMLRSQNIRARYAVATVRAPANDVMSWLGLRDPDLAASVLDDQGIQAVALTVGSTHVEFEHVWVQAFLPVDLYRAAGPATQVDCVATPGSCTWIDLAPAFKRRAQRDPAQLIDVGGTVAFDYDAFYHALDATAPPPADGIERADKGPLEIYEEQILSYLRATFPGKTLQDVADDAPILSERLGLLPESLPFEVVSTIESYDSVAEHDAVSAKNWEKLLQASATAFGQQPGGGACTLSVGTSVSLARLSTERLTFTVFQNGQGDLVQAFRLGGVQSGNSITIEGGGLDCVDPGTPLQIDLLLDGPPDTTGAGTDTVFDETYTDLVAGGYYTISTGGETSNFSQVHRAARQLLQANEDFPIVLDPVGEPHVDTDESGSFTQGVDVPLLEHEAAQDALTGGLLFTAQQLYFARLRAARDRLEALDHVVSPIAGFLGLVSSSHAVEYLDETAFSIMPDGLLIDMKGIQFNGNWRNDQPAETAPAHFELFGHIGSSLEHEVWQEITGFDALSTVRGIQFALRDGAVLIDAKKNATEDTLPDHYGDLGFSDGAAPAPWVRADFSLFGEEPTTWFPSPDPGPIALDLFQRSVDLGTPGLRLLSLPWDKEDLVYDNIQAFDSLENTYLSNPGGLFQLTCDNQTHVDFGSNLLPILEACWNNYIALLGQFFVYIDRAQGFIPENHVYRDAAVSLNSHDRSFVQGIRDDLYLRDVANQWVEYVLPSSRPSGSFFLFSVHLRKQFDAVTGALLTQTYAIQNLSGLVAGGGYVNGEVALELNNSNVFDNEIFTDQNLVSQTNNDLVRTPSTADPVSTVTGNMYHDETDLTIKGRGLHYALTRSYNSGPARSEEDGPFGFGWSHSYGMELRANDYGACPNCDSAQAPENGNGITSSISYVDERGGEHSYLLDPDSASARIVLRGPPGEFNSLQLDTPAIGEHTIQFRNGVRYVFSNAGDLAHTPGQVARLDYIEDPYENRLTMGYDPSGRLISVVDNLGISGRTGLSITYHGSTPHIRDITDWASPNRTWQYGYDADGNLTSYTNPRGDIFTYRYHPGTHLLRELVWPEQKNGKEVKTTFEYYENNRAFSYTNAKGEAEVLDYDLYRKRTRITDPRGFVREHFYDPDTGALVKLREPDGAIVQFANTDDGIRYRHVNGLGFETQYSYQTNRSITSAGSDNNGLLSREVDALQQAMDYDYGLFDQPTTTRDKRGNPIVQSYYQVTDTMIDAVRGKLHEVRATVDAQPDVLLARNTYYASGPAFGQLKRRIEYLDAADLGRQRVTDYVYASNGIDWQTITITGATSGGSIIRTYSFDELGRLESETLMRRASAADPSLIPLITMYEHDSLDRVVRVTDPRGDRRATVYDGNGNVESESVEYLTAETRPGCAPPDGGYVDCTYFTHSYDEANRRISTTDILGHTVTFDYDAIGNLIARTDANGHVLRMEYDRMNRLLATIDQNGHRTERAYDLAGRLTHETDGNGNSTVYTYDALGRRTSAMSPEGRRTDFQYDPDGNLTHVIDANATADPLHPRNTEGATIYREFDELRRVTRELDSLDAETLYTYDLLGNLTSLTDAENQRTTFVYDDLGRLVETLDPVVEAGTDRTDRILLYDQAGNPLEVEDRSGRRRIRNYDVLNRLTHIEYVLDGSQETYVYDDFGDLLTVGNDDVTYTLGYTSRHELSSKLDSRLGRGLSWTYDPVGNVATRTGYEGDVTEYQYDGTNRLVALRNPEFVQVSYHYDGAGRLVDRILSSEARTNYRYDEDNRLTALVSYSADGTPLQDYAYEHDHVGNIEQIAEATSGRTVDYDYDAVYRLISADSTTNAEDRSYTYDSVGNRKTLVAEGTLYHYCYDSADCEAPPNGNRLVEIRTGGLTGPLHRQFSYDDSGRILAKLNGAGATLYALTYDGKGLVSQAGSSVFTYDPTGYRIQKDSKLYHLEGEHLDAVYDAAGQLTEHYLRGAVIDEIVTGHRYGGGAPPEAVPYTFHHDHVNSVTYLSGHTGALAETTGFDPFGAPLNLATPGTGNDLLFTGREYDRATALYYHRARYYDPEIGRFLVEDPIGFSGGINFYAYVGNNPVLKRDPLGLDDLVVGASLSCIGPPICGTGPGPVTTGALFMGTGQSGEFRLGFSASRATGAGLDTGVSAFLGIRDDVGNDVNAFAAGIPLATSAVASLLGITVPPLGGAVEFDQETGDLAGAQLTLGIFDLGLPITLTATSDVPNTSRTIDFLDALPDLIEDPTREFLGDVFDSVIEPTIGRFFGSPDPAAASGGFVLYPSRPNLNSIRAYEK